MTELDLLSKIAKRR